MPCANPPSPAAMAGKEISVLVSVLNWNSAKVTLKCVASLLAKPSVEGISVNIVVIDNGSASDDWALLSKSLSAQPVRLLRQETNLGFAGGHNIAMRMAMAEDADFIWLVNSDAIVEPDCLDKLLELMAARPMCGAASPVTVALDDKDKVDFCGAYHDWKRLESARVSSIEDARRLEREQPEAMWVSGTVVLYRIAALRQIGVLDEEMFAYYEDDDIGARLSQAGWLSLMAFNARASHFRYQSDEHDRPPYFFYLMTRNAILFWTKNTPAAYRRRLKLRLLDRSLFQANILMSKSQPERARACMLGLIDGMRGKGGPPRLERRVPPYLELLRRLLLLQHARHLLSK